MAKITDKEQITSMIGSVKNWYHQIELAPNIITPGINASPLALERWDALGLPKNASGLRVLDIGCRDGFFAFEMEKRGATVIGIDYVPPTSTGFQVASQILYSRVNYIVDNVYNLNAQKYGLFDIVLFLGVLYHLRNPLLALDQVRKVIKPDGLLFVSSELAGDKTIRSLDIPAWQYYPRDTLNNDETNKWAPNLPGLKLIIEDAEFIVQQSAEYGNRGYVTSRAVINKVQQRFRELDSGVSTG